MIYHMQLPERFPVGASLAVQSWSPTENVYRLETLRVWADGNLLWHHGRYMARLVVGCAPEDWVEQGSPERLVGYGRNDVISVEDSSNLWFNSELADSAVDDEYRARLEKLRRELKRKVRAA